MILEGYVRNRCGIPIEKALLEIKNESFVTIYSTESNENGYYQFDIPTQQYPFMTAVKDYAVDYLEYWCQNIPLFTNLSLDVSFGTLEIYGLHVFHVKGAGNGMMVYFRPMSLSKYKQGAQNIAPDDILIKGSIDGKLCSIIAVNQVKEFAAGRAMTAYLIQVETGEADVTWNRFDIQITDQDGNYGAATFFNDRRYNI